MVTIAVDAKLQEAQQIRDMMKGIDPEGIHLAIDDPNELLASLETIRPDIAWLDIMMPGIRGLELAAEIRKKTPDTNIVFVTGHPEYAVDAFSLRASGFILKPVTEKKLLDEIGNLRRPLEKKDAGLLRVQCFGNFEVFADSAIVKFSRSLSKEALAFLVDRRGAGCTVGEICSVLWEDRQADKKLKSQCRVIMAALRKDLTEAGAGDVIVKNWNTWAVDTSKISCDYYEFLKGDNSSANAFRGEYMAQYSWAEMTIGNLFELSDQQ